MGERSRFSLPSLGILPARTGMPNVDEARAALGGRVSTEAGAGACVSVQMKRGAAAVGVLVCVRGDERDVWIGDGRFVRVQATALRLLEAIDPSLAPVARDATRFATLSEGDGVLFLNRHAVEGEGTLVEKCRYGALVSAEDATKVIAVSFRRLLLREA
jgi:hypothetical protein